MDEQGWLDQSVKKESVMQITAAVKYADRDTFSIEQLELCLLYTSDAADE